MSERASIEAGKYTVVEFPDHREFDSEADRLTFLYNLSYFQKRDDSRKTRKITKSTSD